LRKKYLKVYFITHSNKKTMDKNSLLASLTGEADLSGEKKPEQDLFGDVEVDDNDAAPLAVPDPGQQPLMGASLPPTVVAAPTGNGAPAPLQAPAPAGAPPAQPSLLAQSGLLGMASSDSGGDGDSGGGGGMFDEVDQEQERTDAEERRKREEEERKRKEEEERLRKQQQEEEERRRQEEQLRQHQIQQQQQQQMQQQQQQQQMQQQQMQQQQQQRGASYAPQNQFQQPQMQQPQMHQSQQQQSAMMQSAMMQSALITPQPQQQQQQQLNGQMQSMTLKAPALHNGNFYRAHPPTVVGGGDVPQTIGGSPQAPVYQGQGPGNNYYYGTQQQPQIQSPSTTAGMYNSASNGPLGQVRKMTLTKPQDVVSLYTRIVVTEPMLIQTQNFLISSTPYWSYQVTSSLANNQGTWLVRRRFRHIVALEDRLRQSCLGSILPPRPDKHATRALEEASTMQSAEFAMQRAKEMESYLNALANHPVVGQAQELRLFLGLQDDIGTAWSEVSNNAFTRLGAMGAGMSMKVAESTSAATINAHDWEENAELLGLCSSENLRMGGVVTAVPKLEGTATLLREQGDAAGAVGMELSKVSKISDDLKVCDVLSNGLLRHGRRTKRLALELSAAMESFLEQYKTVRYERMAMQDRKTALQRKYKERGRADSRAVFLAQQQRQLQATGQFGQLSSLEQSAIQGDEFALGVVGEAEEIGARLKSEINRIAVQRRTEWNASMKTIASSMKEACGERHAIWQSTLEAFQEDFQESDLSTAS
jgi:actin-related protein